ncbi:MAG: hypothetical protein QOK15_3465 [Nocardioidaceae bacterium]|nr:hypothetical protein [Nocardioidaceae bacterium]
MHQRRNVSRRWFLPLVALLVLVGSLLTGVGGSQAAQPVDEVHYTFTTATSVAIDWRGDANDVQWGQTTAYGNVATGVAPDWTPWSSAGPFWQVKLTGLTRGATYHYSIGGGRDFTFHTPPTGNFRFDAMGDVGDTTSFSKLGATLSGIASDDPNFVLMVGDLTYANVAGASMSVIDQHFNDMMNSWAGSAAYIPAWGNHEYDVAGSDDLRNYKGRLLMPNAQTSPGSPAISCCGDDWGWFDAGPVRFISYPEPWTGAWSDWQSKANTLMNQAQNDPSVKYIITFGHRPAYSTGYHPGEAQLAGILDGFGTAYSKYVLNINGHSHDYERFQPIQGVTHVTVGAPSSLEGPWSSTDPRTAYRAMHLSHLRVDVSDTGLRLQAICDASSSKEDTTCSQGSVMDEWTIGTPVVTPPRTEYYVDKTMSSCSDTGPGNAATPFCTITKGVSRLQAGNTLYIGNGTYTESIKPATSGSAGNPITITSWPGKSPTITGVTNGAYVSTRSYITVSNLTFTGTVTDGIYVTKSDHITVTGNDVSGSGRPAQSQTAPGISLRASNDSTVSGNTSSHNNGHGIYVTNTSTRNLITDNHASYNAEGWQRNANGIDVVSPGNTVLRNVTHDNEDSGIQFFTGGDNNLAALNVTYNNGDHGIDDLNVTGGRIISNTVYHNCTSGINVEGTSTNYVVENNVAVDNAVYPAYNGIACSRRAGNIGIWDSAPGSTTVDHNLVYLSKAGTLYVYKTAYSSIAALQAATGQEAGGVQGDPKFADKAGWDLQLTEGSPAIDRGDSAVSGAQDHDVLGNVRVRDPNVDNSRASGPRAYDDLGAYEFQPDVAPPATGPTAALTVTPTSGTAPVKVTADASGSTDPRGATLSYVFDWGDGTTSTPQSAASATHTYAAAGSYTVKVTVTGSGGLTDSATRTVTVSAAPTAPTARLTATPTSGTAPVDVTADGSASTDPQGQTLSYGFDWGDGTTTSSQSAATATHTYTTAGTYSVALTVTDTAGLTSTATAQVSVRAAPQAPTAKLALTPTSGTAPVVVAADASASTDPQGETLKYAFEWGDGATTAAQSSPNASHTFDAAGTYTVTMTTTNTDGLSSVATQAVTVAEAAKAPTAALSVSPATGTAPVQVTADASGSSDPQRQALTYTFDWGDGSTPQAQASATASHTFTGDGTLTVKVTVTNSSGLSDTATQQVTVAAPPKAPTAALSVSPATGTAPVQVTADASGSTDPQGQTLSYGFDWGDGTSTGDQAAATATHTFGAAGSYQVKVTVTNTAGLTDNVTRTVTVDPAPTPPTARLSVTPTTGTAPVQVTADATASTDPQGQTLSYGFDWGDGTTAAEQPTATASHTFTSAGTYRVTVTVTDQAGLVDTASQSVVVSAPPSPPSARLTVTPASGTAPVQVAADASASTDPQGQALTYAFSWGDGTTTPAQSAAKATHTYTAAGSYAVSVTVRDTGGLTGTTSQTVKIDPAPAYVGQVGTASSGTAVKTATVTLTSPVKAGDMVVLTTQATSGTSKPVTASDSGGTVYAVATSDSDASGAKLTVLYGVTTKALPAGATITVTYGATTAYRVVADVLTGVTTMDRNVTAVGTTTAFSSGATKATAAPRELVLGVVGLVGGNAAPTWANGWTGVPAAVSGTSYLGRAYRTTTATGTFTANGTASGTWTAGAITFRP